MATEVPNRRLRQPASRLATKSHPGERKSHRIRTLFSFFLHFFHFIRLRNGHAGETSGMKKCETKSEPERKKKQNTGDGVDHQMLMQMPLLVRLVFKVFFRLVGWSDPCWIRARIFIGKRWTSFKDAAHVPVKTPPGAGGERGIFFSMFQKNGRRMLTSCALSRALCTSSRSG